MIFTKINCLRYVFRVVGNQERRGGKDNGEAKTMGGQNVAAVGTEKYDKTKLTSRKTSEFHYISLVRKGADYLP